MKLPPTMAALWIQDGTSTIVEVSTPKPRLDEVLVRVVLAGVCGTDLQLLRGMGDFRGVPGHEFVGVIVSDGADGSLLGLRIVSDINLSCGRCRNCAIGRPRLCEQRDAIGIGGHGGAFAEYVSIPRANVVPVPDTLEDRLAVFAEPLAAALQIASQVHITPEARVLVVGAGRLGQLILRVLALTGCQLGAVVKNPIHQLLAEPFCDAMFTPEDVPRFWGDIVVEATGSSSGLEAAIQAVTPGGTLVLKSTYSGTVPVDLTQLVVREVKTVGSRCGSIPSAVRLLTKRVVDPTPLIQAVVPWDKVNDAFVLASRSGATKVIVELSGAGFRTSA